MVFDIQSVATAFSEGCSREAANCMNGTTVILMQRRQQHLGRPRFDRVFTVTAGVVLGITGIGKTWTAFGDVKLLGVVDPILGIQFRYLMLAVGVLELVIAGVCLFGKSNKSAVALVAWLATTLLIYRLGMSWVGWSTPCGCFGNLTDVLHISPQTADNIIKLVLAFLLIGSYGLLFSRWLQQRNLEPAEIPVGSQEV